MTAALSRFLYCAIMIFGVSHPCHRLTELNRRLGILFKSAILAASGAAIAKQLPSDQICWVPMGVVLRSFAGALKLGSGSAWGSENMYLAENPCFSDARVSALSGVSRSARQELLGSRAPRLPANKLPGPGPAPRCRCS